MSSEENVRKEVSQAYARAVQRPACCSTAPKGVAAKLAGYDVDVLADLPQDAVSNSFGCGNPVAFSEVHAGDIVVDLGCGAGIDLLVAARQVGPTGRVIGIDMTADMIERARANLAAAGVQHVEVRRGLIEELPVEDASVDWVISNCVINLSPEKPRVFAEIARVLKPGGRMTVSDIVVEELPDWLRENKSLYCSCVAGAISEAAYLDGLRQAGLTDVEVRERQVYDVAQVVAFLESELSDAGGCCAELAALNEAELQKMSAALQGKVWSARMHARKPPG